MSTFTNIPVPAGTATSYKNFTHDYIETLTIGGVDKYGDKVLAVLIDTDENNNPYVVEWITVDTPMETAVNFATAGQYLVFWDIQGMPMGAAMSIIAAMLHERSLYSDCFHWSEQTVENLPESWVNGENPFFSSALPI